MGETEELLKHLRAVIKLPELEERVGLLEQKLNKLIEIELRKLEALEAADILRALRKSHPDVKFE